MASIPQISVLMPVYNGEFYLNDAIDSILGQTLIDFEFLIINDGSTDNTESIICSYKDPRIKYIKNESNIGLTRSLNKGIELCQGVYIARMDADDISLPERLEKQYNFMRLNPSIAVCGTQSYTIDAKGGYRSPSRVRYTSPMEIKVQNTFFNDLQLLVGSGFFRADILKKYRFNPECPFAEDNYLIAQIINDHLVANLNECLYLYRKYGSSKSDLETDEGRVGDLYKTNTVQLTGVLGYQPDPYLINLYHTAFFLDKFDQFLLSEYQMLFELIRDSNQKSNKFNQELLSKILHNKWCDVVYNKGGKNAMCLLLKSDLFVWSYVTLKQLRRVSKRNLKALF